MKINGFKILGIAAPNMGLVILYPNVFWVIEGNLILQCPEHNPKHLPLPSTPPSSRSKIIVSLLPPAGLFIFLVVKVDKLQMLGLPLTLTHQGIGQQRDHLP